MMDLWIDGKLYACATDEKDFIELVKMNDIRNIKFVSLNFYASWNQEEHFIFSRALARFQELVVL